MAAFPSIAVFYMGAWTCYLVACLHFPPVELFNLFSCDLLVWYDSPAPREKQKGSVMCDGRSAVILLLLLLLLPEVELVVFMTLQYPNRMGILFVKKFG
jgi:hypothetical protein